jgi:hypothetical protein
MNSHKSLQSIKRVGISVIIIHQVICFGEAYRGTYTPLLTGQSEGNWTFGQISPVTLLLLPLVELVRNASSPVAPGGVSKFRAWVNTRNHTPKMKSPIDSSGKLPFPGFTTCL